MSMVASSKTTGRTRDGTNIDDQLLHKLGLYFYRPCWESFEKKTGRDDGTKFDAVIIKPLTAPDRAGMSRIHNMRIDNADIEHDLIMTFPYFCNKGLKFGSFVVLLSEHYMAVSRMSSFSSANFFAMSYSNTFVFETTIVTDRHISGFSKTVCNFAVVARTANRHPDRFQPNFNDKFVYVNRHSPANSVVLSNILWSTKKLTKLRTRELLRRTKKSIRLFSVTVQLFISLESNVMDPHDETFSAAIAAMGIN